MALPMTMRAAVRAAEGLVVADVPVPSHGPDELLVKVRASSLNRADLALAEGRSHGAMGGAGTVLGLEWAGDVLAMGERVQGFRVGDRVMCSGIGGWAEYAVADWRRCFAFPERPMDYESAACLPVGLRTAHVALVHSGALQRGQSVLVLGASSAVGLMCLQVARLMGAGRVIGTSTQAERRGRLAGFGADIALDSSDTGWVGQVLQHTGGRGVDLLIDFLAGPLINDSMRAVAMGGRIVNVGRMAGESGPFDFDLHSLRRIQYIGTTFRTRSPDEVGAIGRQVVADLWPALEAGRLGVPIGVRMPLGQAAAACALMRSNAHFGKIVLTQDPG